MMVIPREDKYVRLYIQVNEIDGDKAAVRLYFLSHKMSTNVLN